MCSEMRSDTASFYQTAANNITALHVVVECVEQQPYDWRKILGIGSAY